MDIKQELDNYKAEALEAYKASLKDEDIQMVEDNNTEADIMAKLNVGSNAVGDVEFSDKLVRKYFEGSALLQAVGDNNIYKTTHGRSITVGVISSTATGELRTESDTGAADSTEAFSNLTLVPVSYGSLQIPISLEFLQDAELNVTDEVIRLGIGRCGRIFDTNKTATIITALGTASVSNNVATDDTVVFSDLKNALHQVKAQYRKDGMVSWMMTDAMFKTISKTVNSDDQPIWPDWVAAIPSLGNIVINDTIADGQILCGNFSEGLAVRLVTEPRVLVQETTVGKNFEVVMRADAQVRNADAMSLLVTNTS